MNLKPIEMDGKSIFTKMSIDINVWIRHHHDERVTTGFLTGRFSITVIMETNNHGVYVIYYKTTKAR